MSLKEWQSALRRQAAERGGYAVSEVSDRWAPGCFNVSGSSNRRTYRAVYLGPDNDHNYCDCMDFRTNCLGTCKHLEAVKAYLKERRRKSVTALPRRSDIYMSYKDGRKLKLHICDGAPSELAMAALRYFDDDMTAVPGMVSELPSFIENAKRIDPHFHCYPDALNHILEARDRRRLLEMQEGLSDAEIASVVKTRLYPYQVEGIRFAFGAGRSLIADEMGLGKTVEAIGTAELLMRRQMAATVLVVCPTSLKYQWKKEIERFTESTVTVVEGLHTQRRELYLADTTYKIVSYHTLANDIKAMGTLHFDVMIMDEVQRLKNWNTQIAQAARRVDSDFSVVLSGTPLENRLDELYSVMQFVDQYALGPYYEFTARHTEVSESGKVTGYKHLDDVSRRLRHCMLRRRRSDVALQLPPRTDQTLYVPMTREQREIHDEARSGAGRLIQKWRRSGFLSEKERKRLLLLLSRMRMVCDSTYVLDQKSRFDTKPGEALQLIISMAENGGKAVVFSQWERMTRILTEELDRAGIGYEYLHGGVASSKRRTLAENFTRDADTRVFVSTDAGATGLNLQAASLVINLDLPWNPAVLEQRISRVYRIGQNCPVQVINMVAAGTIEERMLATLDFKSDLLAGILDGGDSQITLDDSKLDRLSEVFGDDDAERTDVPSDNRGTMVSETEDAVSAGGFNPDDVIAELWRAAGSLGRVLSSAEATERLVDSLTSTDERTGRTVVQIPVESRESVINFLSNISKLFSKR
ncbi:MAG: DEAD/DEAH box helicase [Muribaculaceae bacterium]|nr:DEAD/DEAH box helicase [Muribaculaceae bacterium]